MAGGWEHLPVTLLLVRLLPHDCPIDCRSSLTFLPLIALLQAAEAAGGALSFACIMPGWQEVAGWQLLQSSPFLRECLLVAAADHGFCDGSSHQARDPYRQSPFDSGLFILQTSAAAKKWGVTPPLVAQLRTAMAACVPSAAAAERQRKQRGQNDLEWQGLIKN